MIDFEKILMREGVKKQDFAETIGEKPQNLKRTFERLNKNLSEIDNMLLKLNTSLGREIGGVESDNQIASLQRTIENLSETIKNLTAK